MVRTSRRVVCGTFFVVAALSMPAAVCVAQEPTPALHVAVQVDGSLPRPEGLSFDVFGPPSSVVFVIQNVNGSPGTVVFPGGFATNLSAAVERDGRPVPSTTSWEGADVALPFEDVRPVSISAPFDLAPEEVLRLHGTVRPDQAGSFEPGHYKIAVKMQRALRGITDQAGRPFSGYMPDEAVFGVRVIDPKTRDEIRLARLAAANHALLHGNPALGLQHCKEMLGADPDDIDAQGGAAQAYMDLERYKEAAAAYDVLLRRPSGEERSALPILAAYAHLAIGEDERAEEILVAAYGAESGRRRLQQIRQAVRRR